MTTTQHGDLQITSWFTTWWKQATNTRGLKGKLHAFESSEEISELLKTPYEKRKSPTAECGKHILESQAIYVPVPEEKDKCKLCLSELATKRRLEETAE